MNSERAQELGPCGTDELAAVVGKEPARSSEVWDNMPHESFADRVGSVVAGGDEDGVLRIAVYKDNQELVAVVRREWSHNVN